MRLWQAISVLLAVTCYKEFRAFQGWDGDGCPLTTTVISAEAFVLPECTVFLGDSGIGTGKTKKSGKNESKQEMKQEVEPPEPEIKQETKQEAEPPKRNSDQKEKSNNNSGNNGNSNKN